MGEYADYKGERVKIGTCQTMTDLRPDQIYLVTPVPTHLDELLFRFPFPHEDKHTPGNFERAPALGVYGWEPPTRDDLHTSTQFKSTYPDGWLVMLPCPLSDAGKATGLKFGMNGFPGPVKICYQRILDGVWATSVQCGGCGSTFTLRTVEEAAGLLAALQIYVEREFRDESRAKFYRTVAERIERGYSTPAPAQHVVS